VNEVFILSAFCGCPCSKAFFHWYACSAELCHVLKTNSLPKYKFDRGLADPLNHTSPENGCMLKSGYNIYKLVYVFIMHIKVLVQTTADMENLCVLLPHNVLNTTEPMNKTHHNAHEYWRETSSIMIIANGIFGGMTSHFYLEALWRMRGDIHLCHVSSHGPGLPGPLPLCL